MEQQQISLEAQDTVLRGVKSRQLERQVLTKGAFSKASLSSALPRNLRRAWSRMAMKIARRTLNQVWEHPLTVRDYKTNQRLRREGLALDREIDAYIEANS